ncbi:MoxR-like ATPase [Plantibacter flavus]|uniref:MoxR-like ATPase n=1 Tax=Plantibacter flavus TaxID=150123 RepID=A0A3N2C474_9MICO|nr:MoxR family ATPase [Plantibacter flavus]ROR82230.1 MoxR-like ATPase [Plantibacter flavus]SMG42569.1 MoxR-like ATPase [Plantibacter flavus]
MTPRQHTETMTEEQAVWFAEVFASLVDNVELVVLGKTRIVQLAITTLVSEGHLLLEDAPGTGKTSLARAIAQTIDGSSGRIQFTPDLLPGDVTGMSIYDQQRGVFEFHPGPVFSNVLLADEINRASPKTQSALLEVMEESRVTVDGVTHAVPAPFMTIATQNPVEQAGTYRLPEAQLDRFLMKTSLGYPDALSTRRILEGVRVSAHQRTIPAVLSLSHLDSLVAVSKLPHTDPTILDYVARLVDATRAAPEVRLGSSIRGALALLRSSMTWAASQGRTFVLPDDVKQLAEPVLAHRLVLEPEAEFDGVTASSVLAQVVLDVEPPAERLPE